MKKAIIYLHGFNSASLDLSGHLLTSKQKLLVLEHYCKEKQLKFYTPNVDYRDFKKIISDLTQLYGELENQGFKVLFMGSSLGGFTSEYMAMKTHSKAIMINPAIHPSKLLTQYISVTANFETGLPFDWTQVHCEQFISYEEELKQKANKALSRTVLLDMADELIDSSKTLEQYKDIAEVVTFAGGSHGFDHMEEALPVFDRVISHLT